MPRTDDRTADSLTPESLRRIDPPHATLAAEPSILAPMRREAAKRAAVTAVSSPSQPQRILRSSQLAQPLDADDWCDADEVDLATGELLLRLHAAELIDRLQRWSRDLDARQSQLNLQSASQDHRERQFRLSAQARETELQERLRTIEQHDKNARDSAHRLALAELANQPQ